MMMPLVALHKHLVCNCVPVFTDIEGGGSSKELLPPLSVLLCSVLTDCMAANVDISLCDVLSKQTPGESLHINSITRTNCAQWQCNWDCCHNYGYLWET